MYRTALDELKHWKENPNRKPLIVDGARQVGKTWLMQEFGRTCYTDTVYLNCDSNKNAGSVFSGDLSPEILISRLEILTRKNISPETTLIILDEIQEVPRALTSLKYFCEEAREYHIVCAGSLLGVALHGGISFPVGKVDFLHLYPLTFKEFLIASGEERLAGLLNTPAELEIFRDRWTELLKQYYYVGGMPEAVSAFLESHDYREVRRIQEGILSAYEQDFSKHVPDNQVLRIRQLWDSLPAQFAKENRKFKYGIIKTGARSKEYETALLWLKDCGLVHQVQRVSVPKLPLKAYTDEKAFKLYLSDIGLLAALSGLDERILLDDRLFSEFKGALTEQYVCQELTAAGIQPYYWANDNGTAEIDFLITGNSGAVPLEVKAGINLQAKSLKVYRDRFSPEKCIRISLAGYRDDGWVLNIPLASAGTYFSTR